MRKTEMSNEAMITVKKDKGDFSGTTIEIPKNELSIPFFKMFLHFKTGSPSTKKKYRRSVYFDEELYREKGERRVALKENNLRCYREQIMLFQILKVFLSEKAERFQKKFPNSHQLFRRYRKIAGYDSAKFLARKELNLSPEDIELMEDRCKFLLKRYGTIYGFKENTKPKEPTKQSQNQIKF